jgi:hypothetical protein
MALICTALEPLIDWIDSRQICLGVINGPKIKRYGCQSVVAA